VIWGGAGHDVLLGGGDNDRLRGDAGNDTLRGELGDDSLLGNDGADQLLGGIGENRLTGGRGADQFIFGKQAEVSVVTDFTDGLDKLVFSSARGLTEAYLMAHAVQVGGHVVLTTTVIGTEITVQNTTIAALAGDILIV
jgi:Ca2+-binding RTX toxin-like protein